MVWSNEQRAFAVETYFSQIHSIVAVQRAFRTRYQIPPQDRVPDRKSILLWVENFRGMGSVSKKRRGRPRTSRTPENIEAVRRSILQSPRCSARKHASALGISNRSVHPILHQDLHFHPYKMVVVQELTQQDWINRVEACQHISWPARSPDLTPCDYFLWGYLKAEVFKHRPRTLQTLKDAIRLEVARIPHDMLDRVTQNIRIHLQQFIDNNSHHLQDILFKNM